MPNATTHAQNLFEAWYSGTPLSDAPLSNNEATSENGEFVQSALSDLFDAAGRESIGWKIGLTSTAALAAFNAHEPMVGRLYRDSALSSGETLDLTGLISPRIEGEILIEIGSVVEGSAADLELLQSIRSIRPAFEIADSRIPGWASDVANAIADNACCGKIVIPENGIAPDSMLMQTAAMQITADAVIITQGSADTCLGGVLNVYRWFIENSSRCGRHLSPGDFLLTGAMGPAIPMIPATQYVLSVDGFDPATLLTR